MIVRISNEGQYEVPEGDVERLRELDDQAVSACAADDEVRFRTAFDALLDFVRGHGEVVPDVSLESSEMIIPPADSSLAEAKAEFSGEGLLPD